MPIQLLPVGGDPRRHAAQDVRRQVLHAHPRQDQEAGVVGDEADAAAPRRGIPAGVVVAAGQMAQRR
jgi:hypothetical protein